MGETRGEQGSFEWAGQGGESSATAGEPPAAQEPVRKPASRRARKASCVAAGDASAVATAQESRPPTARAGEAAGPPARPSALPPDDELWDVHAAARFMKRSVSWVYHRAEDGSLPVKRLAGWGLRFIPGELRAWVESGGARRSGR